MRSLLFLLAIGCATQPAPGPDEAAQNEEKAATEAAPAEAAWDTYGEPPTATETVAAADLLSNPESFEGKTVRVAGRVADVCQKAGCWMILTDDTGKKMRIRMKDHGFSVAKDGEGREADIEGVVVGIDPDPATAEHFKSESKNLDAIPEGEGEKKTWEMVASGVRMKRPSPT